METPSISEVHSVKSSTLDSQIAHLLQRNNELLEALNQQMALKSVRDQNKQEYWKTRITDIDMSIGSMVSLSFKWLIASIPVGLVIFVLWFFVTVIFSGAIY